MRSWEATSKITVATVVVVVAAALEASSVNSLARCLEVESNLETLPAATAAAAVVVVVVLEG